MEFQTRDRSLGLRSRHYSQYSAAVVMSTSLQSYIVSALKISWCMKCSLLQCKLYSLGVQPLWLHELYIARYGVCESVVYLPVFLGLYLSALRAGMICCAISEFAKKPSVQVFTEVRSWRLATLQFCSFVLVIECDVLSIRSCKYRLFRGGIRVLEITLIYFTLDSLSSTFYTLGFYLYVVLRYVTCLYGLSVMIISVLWGYD